MQEGQAIDDRLLGRLRRSVEPELVLLGPSRAASSIAVLSGSFDPITVGHLALAEAALSLVDLAILCYSVRTMPKDPESPPHLLPEGRRLQVLQAVCRARPRHVAAVCSHGLLVDQARAVHAAFPRSRPWLAMGSDKVLQLLDPRWYEDRDAELDVLFRHAGIVYAERAGHQGMVSEMLVRPENRRWRASLRRVEVPPPALAISSSEVRRLIAEGGDVASLVPPEVAALLGLPRPEPMKGVGSSGPEHRR